jgi:hypothetical protein
MVISTNKAIYLMLSYDVGKDIARIIYRHAYMLVRYVTFQSNTEILDDDGGRLAVYLIEVGKKSMLGLR